MRFLILTFSTLWFSQASAQLLKSKSHFTLTDSLRGYLNENRRDFIPKFYDLDIQFDIQAQSISGRVGIAFVTRSRRSKMQLDLSEKLTIDSIVYKGKKLKYDRHPTHLIVHFNRSIPKNKCTRRINVYYHGSPQKAKNPPWDGGLVWTRDKLNRPYIGVACEGDGASIWWPCIDHWSLEPDSVHMRYTVDSGLVAVGNGRLIAIDTLPNARIAYKWSISSPINLYNINFTIGALTHFSGGIYRSKVPRFSSDSAHKLSLDYYVLDYNLDRAREHFAVVPQMLDCFEDWVGPYPFYRDGYKLVETPYLGMEHQSAIAYGNQYKMGYLGNTQFTNNHLFDYIIIHETGHEWFGNSITAADPADMWIHEAYTTYMESLYIECLYGHEAALRYIDNRKHGVDNTDPIRGPYHVAKEGHGDMYDKGSLIINTLRHQLSHDSLWKPMMRRLHQRFYHQTIHYDSIVQFYSEHLGRDMRPFFDQYVSSPHLPALRIDTSQRQLTLTWMRAVPNFDLIVHLVIDGEPKAVLVRSDTPTRVPYQSDYQIDTLRGYFDLVKLK